LIKIEHSTIKDNHFFSFRQLDGSKKKSTGHVPFYMGHVKDGGSLWGKKMKKMRVKRHVTVT
jgi:hypothetical protein